MKSNLILLVFSIMLTSALIAQTPASVVIVSTSGKVKYESPSYKKPIALNPGSVVNMDGSLILESGDKALCLVDDKFIQIMGPGKKSIRKAVESNKAKPVINFDGEFSQYVRSAVQFKAAVNEKDGWGKVVDASKSGDGWAGITNPKPSDDGWGGITNPKPSDDGWSGITNPKPSDDGWGDAATQIAPRSPIGKLVPEITEFKWTGSAAVKQYRLEILNSMEQVVHTQLSKKTSAEVDMVALKLKTGEMYSWRVAPAEATSAEGYRSIKFTPAAKKDQDAAMRKSLKTKLSTATDPSLKLMMEAVALEQEEYHAAALAKYEAALAEDPRNEMVRMNYSAFLMRNKWTDGSQSIMKGGKL
ncbi:MAG TPA: hypothetical protein VFX48_05850 [Saprospiraceae bacterium]|nr:hypothetical protein [Saprospiraceae bacterium]